MERILKTLFNLNRNGFDAYLVENIEEAKTLFIDKILDTNKHLTASYADSMTMKTCGVLEYLRGLESVNVIETFSADYTQEEKIAKRREALLSDIFLTGSNAVTMNGEILNLDMIGNRVAAITFGPKEVVLFIGVNKIVDNLESAKQRIKEIAAPENAIRHTKFKTPCQGAGICLDCDSVDRICNVWTLHEKCFPKGRIKVILINQKLGL
jgi:L-lactate utilization protein LutB